MNLQQGAVLGVKLRHLSKWTDGRRAVASKYRELLSDIEELKLPVEMDYAKHVYHLFVVQVKGRDDEERKQRRDELQKYLGENEIASGLHYPIPLHEQKCFEGLGYNKGDFPVSDLITVPLILIAVSNAARVTMAVNM